MSAGIVGQERELRSRDEHPDRSVSIQKTMDLPDLLREKMIPQVEGCNRADLADCLERKLGSLRVIPEKTEGIEVFEEVILTGERKYTLCNPENTSYINLNENSFYLWSLINGKRSVGDLISEVVDRYGAADIRGVRETLVMLSRGGFFKPGLVSLDELLIEHFEKSTCRQRFKKIFGWLVHDRFELKKLDRFFEWASRFIFRPFYTRVGFTVSALFALAGFVLFFYFFHISKESLFMVSDASRSTPFSIIDTLIIYLIYFLSMLIHECAHGATVKHYGRRVISAGFLIYYGLPFFFVDTTDILMKDRRDRIRVSFAGPFSNGVLAGVFLLATFLMQTGLTREILLTSGILNAILFIFNLLPIAETDGHYIIEDFTRIPGIRCKAFNFLRHRFIRKLRKRSPWSREDIIFLVYGLISVTGTFYLIYLAVELWWNIVYRLIVDTFSNPELLVPILGVMGVLFLIRLARYTLWRIKLRGGRLDHLAV